jgi:deoxyribose-phosphate aldolase
VIFMRTIADILLLAEKYEKELPPAPQALVQPVGAALAGWIDHTLLKPDATAEQIKNLCVEARQNQFVTVCVNPVYVPLAAGLLRDSGVGVCSVIAFPLGANLPASKAAEARDAISAGATEIDMVINIGAMKSAAYGLVQEDITAVVAEAHRSNVQVKVILEMVLLNQREKIIGCLVSQSANADFVKTSTGFASGGATVDDVSLMRRVVGEKTGVKAAGGIRTLKDARSMINAGADRLGASAGVTILKEAIEEAGV